MISETTNVQASVQQSISDKLSVRAIRCSEHSELSCTQYGVKLLNHSVSPVWLSYDSPLTAAGIKVDGNLKCVRGIGKCV